MIKCLTVIAALGAILAATPAVAQQPSPSATAIQIDNIINQWALTLEAQAENLKAAQEKIDGLQKENADLKAAAASAPKENKP